MATYKGRNMSLLVNGVEIIRAQDVTVNRTADTAETTSRQSGGYREKEQDLKDWNISFQMIVDSGDTARTTLETIYENGTKVTVSVDLTTGTKTGTAIITDITEEQPLEGVVTMNVTLEGSGALSS